MRNHFIPLYFEIKELGVLQKSTVTFRSPNFDVFYLI